MKHYSSHHDTAKHVASFLILLVAFSILIVFYLNSEYILKAGQFNLFVITATAGAILLVSLLYLINKPHEVSKAKAHKSITAKSAKKNKRK